MDNRPIGFFDSGIGGLPYLAWTRDMLPREQYIYLADTAHFPYGSKTIEVVKEAVLGSVFRMIQKYDPKLVVIACNTASVIALEALREQFSVPFVGVVPAVKPAAERSNGKRIGVLATTRTVENGYTDALINTYASDCIVTRNSGGGLVDFVENSFSNASEETRREKVIEVVKVFENSGVDTVVLGCTHFVYLESYFREALGETITVIDSRDGVANRIISVLENYDMFGDNEENSYFYTTGDSANRGNYLSLARTFQLAFMGPL